MKTILMTIAILAFAVNAQGQCPGGNCGSSYNYMPYSSQNYAPYNNYGSYSCGPQGCGPAPSYSDNDNTVYRLKRGNPDVPVVDNGLVLPDGRVISPDADGYPEAYAPPYESQQPKDDTTPECCCEECTCNNCQCGKSNADPQPVHGVKPCPTCDGTGYVPAPYPPVEAQGPEHAPPVATPLNTLVFRTGEHCIHCERWRNDVLPSLKAKGWHIQVVVETDPTKRIPSFTYQNESTTGYTTKSSWYAWLRTSINE